MSLKNIFKRKPKKKEGLVEIKVENFTLLANAEHRLEIYLNNHKYYSRNLPRIAKLIEQKYPTYGIVDIGANIGDTIALVRSAGVDQLIYAIEGDPMYFDILKKNATQFKNFELFKAFLGEENGTENFSLQTTGGTANLVQLQDSVIQIEKFDGFAVKNKIENVKLFKVDTDGFDFKIIRGGWEFIKRDKPVLFFEYDANFLEGLGEDGTALLDELYNIGYRTAVYYDNFGKMLVSVSLENKDILKYLYAYVRKGEGAFHYYDVCLFHQDDNKLAQDVVKSEMQFFH